MQAYFRRLDFSGWKAARRKPSSRWSDSRRRKSFATGITYGAYRIVSGDKWIVLIGDDTDSRPIEPWPRSNSDWLSGRVHAEWHRITESNWGNPLSQLRKHYTGWATTFGTRDHESVAEDGTVYVWGFDERGSFNAVCGFLRKLGMRWYMPGDVGDHVSQLVPRGVGGDARIRRQRYQMPMV